MHELTCSSWFSSEPRVRETVQGLVQSRRGAVCLELCSPAVFLLCGSSKHVCALLRACELAEARDLVIVPLLALSFVWTCGVLYLLLKRRASPLNTMWPSRALLVITAFCWQGCFAFTTGRAQMTDLGITAQEQCRLFIFADFGVFEPWFCLALMLSLNIQWPRCVVSLITRLSACTCRSSATDGTIAHTGHSSSRQAPGPDGLHSDETYPLPMEDSMSAGGMTARSAASEAVREASRGMGWRPGAGGEGGGREGEDRRHGFWEQRKTRIWGNGISKEGGGGGGYYYLTPSVSIIASIVMLFPSLVFNLAWYRVVVLGKEWSPMRLQVTHARARTHICTRAQG